MSPSSTFQYVFIPADSSKTVEARTADTSGGLSNDALVQNAKNYFFQQSGGAAKVQALKNASPEQRQAFAEDWKQSQPNNPHIQQLSNDQILTFLESTHASPSCEIMALTVPTPGNGHEAVSMYVSDSTNDTSHLNERASNLLQACGHRLPESAGKKAPGVYGDVFVGRCYDHEGQDEWKRVDFEPEDLDPDSDWIQVAKSQGGGGGSGASNAASLSGTMSQLQQNQQDEDFGYKWDQTEEEVELRFTVSADVSAKQIQVKFARNSLKVKVAGETLVDGSTGGITAVDDSTYTLQNAGDGRELCVVLGKQEEGRVWAYAVR
jgi:hypothetical protein